MDVSAIIQAAKLGRSRKDAQVDTCAVFAAALYDVLSAQGIACQMIVVEKKGLGAWAHSVVEVAGKYYDSMGEFSTSIYRTRAKVHPKVVDLKISYQPDFRNDCYEPEFDEMHAFYVKMLNKAFQTMSGSAVASDNEMSDEAFDILRVAVTLAKNDQIRTVERLRTRLLQLFPNKEAQTEAAILCWARCTQDRKCSYS